ncbi:MAG: prolyl aminopeptidase [Pseudomonadota bacterium]
MPYPDIEPFRSGHLDVGNGYSLYFECCGAPRGKPALVLHGGPGSGVSPSHRRLFDPTAYEIILFDQRGCGRSTPSAAVDLAALNANTTHHLIADIERLRTHLGIETWLVFGGSWGTTLALAYAEAHPDRVTELVLAGVATTRRSEIDWLYGHVGFLLPEAFARFRAGAPEGEPGFGLVEAYAKRLQSPDPAIHDRAAQDWCAWELAVIEAEAEAEPATRWRDPDFRRCFARIVTHYFAHDAWFDDNALIDNVGRLTDIPGVLIHSRLDLATPLATAWTLAQVWPASELVLLEGGLHSASETRMADAIVAATDRFRHLS